MEFILINISKIAVFQGFEMQYMFRLFDVHRLILHYSFGCFFHTIIVLMIVFLLSMTRGIRFPLNSG